MLYSQIVFGFFNINKAAGPTSHDVVAAVRRLLPPRTKAGHCGTLDPFAEGVLVISAGPATRLASYVQDQPKRYHARITLGARSTTDDSEGDITETPAVEPPAQAEVRNVLEGFVGLIKQVPPAYSAVHVNGQRAYDLARAGKQLELPPREVTINRIDLLSYDYPSLQIDVRCGSGTYIRALGRDVGEALGVGAYCSGLTRTEVGPFHLEAARSLEDLDPQRDLLPPLTPIEHLPRVVVDDVQAQRVGHGNPIRSPEETPSGEVAILDVQGCLLAIASVEEDHRTLHPTKVFAHS